MLHLPDMAKQGHQVKLLTIDDRLPSFLRAPCHLSVTYSIEANDDFYLLHLRVLGELNSICQRCLQEFHFSYDNPTNIAVCRSDERAEQLLEQYECVVSTNFQVDLEELIIDELHLYAPQVHPLVKDCDSEINKFITGAI